MFIYKVILKVLHIIQMVVYPEDIKISRVKTEHCIDCMHACTVHTILYICTFCIICNYI